MKLAVALVLLAGTAHADDAGDLAAAIKSPKALKAMLGDPVSVGPVLFHGGTCAQKFHGPVKVASADRDALVTCLVALALENEADLSPLAWSGNEGVLFTFTFAKHKITAIGPYAASKADATFPVIAVDAVDGFAFAPSPATANALDKRKQTARAVFKACTDGSAPAKGRVIKPSGNAAFDREAAAFLAKTPIPDRAFFVDNIPQVACVVSSLRYPGDEPPAPTPVVTVDVPAPPPPSGPPNIMSSELVALRISGMTSIEPDAVTRQQIIADGHEQVAIIFRICIDEIGAVASAKLLAPSGYPAYDTAQIAATRGWKFKPYRIDGKPSPACSVVHFTLYVR